MNEHINEIIEESINEKNFRKIRENNLYLSDNQVEILERNHIPWKKCTNTKELIFYIERTLSEEENEQLDLLAEQLQEQEYYINTRK